MVFFRLAFKYLLPKRKTLSSGLISFVSLIIVTLVVWLVLVFLSVTTGIENTWLKKLTTLHAPLRITPSSEYYNSYYHQIDKYSTHSQFTLKTIGEKASSPVIDPYNPLLDRELPEEMAFHTEKRDLVKETYKILNSHPEITYQDYELAGALLKLNLKKSPGSFLSQMSYLLSMPDKNPELSNLLLTPALDDINHVLESLDQKSSEEVLNFFQTVNIHSVQTTPRWHLSYDLLNKQEQYNVWAAFQDNELHSIIITNKLSPQYPFIGFTPGKLVFTKKWVFIPQESQNPYSLNPNIPLKMEAVLHLDAMIDTNSLQDAKNLNEVLVEVKGVLQNKSITGKIPFTHLSIATYDLLNKPSLFWAYSQDKKVYLPSITCETPVLVAKSTKNQGVFIGDTGYLSYSTFGLLANNEKRIPIVVAGFYDPGFLPVGNRFIFVPSEVTKTIGASFANVIPDHTPTNGIFIWLNDLKKANEVKEQLQNQLNENHLFSYWKVESFHDYEFSKDLMEQFQSDRTLFTLVALIILLVACSNIVSSLILLVHDKKKEIAVLQAIGATRRQIILLFGFCGFMMGLLSSILGILAAYFTLHYIDGVAALLSFIQGHTAFHAAFFGDHLPNTLSESSVLFILIATPVLSLVAGLIPAWKCMKISPSSELRSNI